MCYILILQVISVLRVLWLLPVYLTQSCCDSYTVWDEKPIFHWIQIRRVSCVRRFSASNMNSAIGRFWPVFYGHKYFIVFCFFVFLTTFLVLFLNWGAFLSTKRNIKYRKHSHANSVPVQTGHQKKKKKIYMHQFQIFFSKIKVLFDFSQSLIFSFVPFWLIWISVVCLSFLCSFS